MIWYTKIKNNIRGIKMAKAYSIDLRQKIIESYERRFNEKISKTF